MRDIVEMDDMMRELQARWDKAHNYFASFGTVLFKVKAQFDTGIYGPEWTFEAWLSRKVGLPTAFVMQQLKLFHRALAGADRAKVEEANYRLAAEKRKVATAKREAAEAVRTAREEAKAAKERLRLQTEAAEKAAKKLQRPKATTQADWPAFLDQVDSELEALPANVLPNPDSRGNGAVKQSSEL